MKKTRKPTVNSFASGSMKRYSRKLWGLRLAPVLVTLWCVAHNAFVSQVPIDEHHNRTLSLRLPIHERKTLTAVFHHCCRYCGSESKRCNSRDTTGEGCELFCNSSQCFTQQSVAVTVTESDSSGPVYYIWYFPGDCGCHGRNSYHDATMHARYMHVCMRVHDLLDDHAVKFHGHGHGHGWFIEYLQYPDAVQRPNYMQCRSLTIGPLFFFLITIDTHTQVHTGQPRKYAHVCIRYTHMCTGTICVYCTSTS